MNLAVIAALAACLAFSAAGPYLARALPPHAAVRLLVPAALLSAGCAVFVVATVAFTLVGQLAEVAEFGRWSPHALHVLDPIPAPVAVAAAALLISATVWTVGNAWRTGRALLAAQRLCRHLDDPSGSPFVVVERAEPDAFTTPGLHARIVVTTGMLAVLDPPGRRVLLAHEQSHRSLRHTTRAPRAQAVATLRALASHHAITRRPATGSWDATGDKHVQYRLTTAGHDLIERLFDPRLWAALYQDHRSTAAGDPG